MTQPKRRILVTSALPYANGAIHLGHMVEHIQTDIWVRFQRLRGHECHYVCADDAHGTPIMLRAEKEGISPQALIDKSRAEHCRDFAGFLIDHHCYHSTHSEENRAITTDIYNKLDNNGHILRRTISQLYDPEKNLFLPDRFVKGECPKCHAKDQYGDNCENCGTTYAPTDLIQPYSVLSGAAPVLRDSEHYFFDLPAFDAFLRDWLQTADLQDAMRNKLAEWFEAGLQPWDISRDAPYWGFEIPNAPGKYFYVWLDAPIGYMGAFRALCDSSGIDYDAYWRAGSDTELYHFIGKDIAYFHMLFWPAMLEGAGYRKPSGVYCHGFLTVNGEKMSKSRGTFIKAETYLKHLPPENLRYYYAAKLSARVEDLDLNLDDFRQKNNSDLVGKLVNLASRCAPFLEKHFANQLADALPDTALLNSIAAKAGDIADAYERREYSQAMRDIMKLADAANEYIDAEKPWVKAKDEASRAAVQTIATVGLNAYRQLITYLKPVLPQLAEASEAFLNIAPLAWDDAQHPLLGHTINPYQPLMQRIDEKTITAVINDSKEDLKEEASINKGGKPVENENWISIDDFAKPDLRIARVLECGHIDGSDKLLRFKLDVGELGEREVFSGIKAYYQPEDLIGRMVVYVANLAPRKMRFGVSTGMILSATSGGELHLLNPGDGVKAGMKIS